MEFGATTQFWGIYIFLINRIHRELQRCVKMNDVDGYIDVFPAVLDVFFALHRPNYTRWGTLFIQRLLTADPALRDVLQKGAFSVWRTLKNYSRSAVDLSLEQSVNRDSASSMRGIVSFRNSETALRRWSLTMTQRALAVTELRALTGLEISEQATAQCRPSRIRKDNDQMKFLSEKIDESCNPFSVDALTSLVNVATGYAASKTTENYLLKTLQWGSNAREKFQEWKSNSGSFLQPVKRTKIQNFAAENVKRKVKVPALQKAISNAEGLRDAFIRLTVAVGEEIGFYLRNVLSFPIISYPLSIVHCDGSRVKTDKAALLNMLESMQTVPFTENDLPQEYAQIFDGGLLLHSTVSQTNIGASYGSIARSMLSTV
ncbi:hypothetical protein Pcinc_032273 [Petrolisthes cinctipes]|uniref:Uncharacterized protein n=1 Tax=Petrolisthes cinctipes TaxID=88211 RepID=A0AAE1EUS7_PETCI|nr:hypothetical protein Pcinc_032273 [Petrolisthes cinctipes]